jgi:hypothetical protein
MDYFFAKRNAPRRRRAKVFFGENVCHQYNLPRGAAKNVTPNLFLAPAGS